MAEADPEILDFEGDQLGFVFPVYAWSVPPIVERFVNRLSPDFIRDVNNREIPVWMVCTCGDDIGRTDKRMEKILERKGLKMKGAWSVIMPNTYVLLPGFDVDPTELEQKKLKEAEPRITEISKAIRQKKFTVDVTRGTMPRIKTNLIFPLFRRYGINPQKWHWNSRCIKCNKCESVCPVGNIEMKEGHPLWHNKCISCLACYHHCPTHAINYGKITRNKGQYFCKIEN